MNTERSLSAIGLIIAMAAQARFGAQDVHATSVESFAQNQAQNSQTYSLADRLCRGGAIISPGVSVIEMRGIPEQVRVALASVDLRTIFHSEYIHPSGGRIQYDRIPCDQDGIMEFKAVLYDAQGRIVSESAVIRIPDGRVKSDVRLEIVDTQRKPDATAISRADVTATSTAEPLKPTATATVAPTPIPAPVGPPAAPGPERPPIIQTDPQSCSIEMPLIPHWLIKMPSDWPASIWGGLWGTNPECEDRNAINIVGWAATLLLYRNRRAARIAAGVPPLITIPVINYRFI